MSRKYIAVLIHVVTTALLTLHMTAPSWAGSPPAGTIIWAKSFADNSTLPSALTNKVVSRAFPGLGYFYIQEPGCGAGIRVVDDVKAFTVRPGDVVSVSGKLTTVDGERAIISSGVTIGAPVQSPRPLGLNNRTLCGGDLNAFTPGASGAVGLNNVGLLVRTAGKVVSVGSGFFCLDDGAKVKDGSVTGVRITGAAGYTPQQDDMLIITGVCGLTLASGSPARVLRIGSLNDVTFISHMPHPTNPLAVSCGSGKIGIYWDRVPNALGYNVYRGTSPGSQDYVHPLNGSTPITSPSYTGGSVYRFIDSGLTDGREYYYTVKAVGALGLSKPSDEVSEIPSFYAIPWDSSSVSAVISAIQSYFFPTFTYIRACAPDGRIYDSTQTNPLLPDGAVLPGSSMIQLTSGEVIPGPNDAGELGWGTSTAADGIYRRVISNPGYYGASGTFYLPFTSGINLVSGKRDTPYLYFGAHYDNPSADTAGGLRWQKSRSNWEAFQVSCIRSGANDRRYLLNYTNRGTQNLKPGTSPVLQHFLMAEQGMTVLTVSGVADSGSDVWACVVNAHPVKQEPAQMKRVHSLAQAGYASTGSYIRGEQAHGVQLMDAYYDVLDWTATETSQEGSYPASPAVSWHVITPYTDEDTINIGP